MVVSSPAYAAKAGGGIVPLATTGVSVSPNPYDPTSGQTLTVTWAYDTIPHTTLITVSGPVSESYVTYGGLGTNTYPLGCPDWPDGYYTITVAPNDEWSNYSGSTGLTVKRGSGTQEPPPPAPPPPPHPAPTAIRFQSNPLYAPKQTVYIPVPHFAPPIPAVNGAMITVSAGGATLQRSGSSQSDGDYFFEFTPPATGTVTVTASYLFVDGIPGDTTSASFTYVPKPAAPSITSPLPSVSGDRVVTVTGTVSTGGTPVARVIVTNNGATVAALTPQGGSWSTRVTLNEGYNHIVAVAQSPAGISSDPSNALDTLYNALKKYDGDLAPRAAQQTLGGSYTSGFWADPINTATGNFIHSETDLVIYGRLPIVFERYYNSLDPYFGALGNGWRHSFEYALDLSQSGLIVVSRLDGRQDNYHLKNGAIEQPPGVADSLSKEPTGGYSLKTQAGLTYVFDPAGSLTSIHDRDGRTLTVAHTTAGGFSRVTSVRDQSGRGLAFAHDGRGRITSAVDHAGRKVSFQYDDFDNLTVARSVDGQATTYRYDDKDQMTEIVGPDGRTVIRNLYEDKYRVIEQYDALSQKTALGYDRQNNLVTVTAPDGKRTVDKYDERFRLLERTDRDGKKIGFEYDQYGYRGRAFFKDGLSTVTTHDARGDVTSVTGRDGVTWNLGYDADSNLTSMVDPNGNRSAMAYDTKGHLTSYGDPTGVSAAYEYDSRANLTKVTKPSGVVTHLAYDADGQLTRIWDDRGTLAAFTYTVIGLPETVTDPRGGVTRYEYDAAGRPTKVTDPLGRVTAMAYNWRGQVTSQSLPGGNVVTYDYNVDGTLARVRDSLGRGASYTYDSMGNVLTETDALGNTATYERDAEGRVTAAKDATGAVTHYEYDVNGRLTAVRSPSGGASAFEYDAAGHVLVARNAVGARGQDQQVEATSGRIHAMRLVQLQLQSGHGGI